MKKLLIILVGMILLFSGQAYAANKYWAAGGLTGGATGDLDDIATASLTDGDIATVCTISGTDYSCYAFVFDADDTTAESSPVTIHPDDNGGTGVWGLIDQYVIDLDVAGNLVVDGTSTLTGNVTVGGTMDVTGAHTADSYTSARSATPQHTFRDLNCTDSDANVYWVVNCTDTGSGTEDCDISLWIQIGGTATEVVAFDADGGTVNFADFEIVTSGAIYGLMKPGADITANTAHDTTELHGVMYKFTAAATVTLDAAADANYGACASYRIRDAAEAAVLDLDDAEKFNIGGAALAAGVGITATGIGDFVTVCATTDADGSGTDGYDVYGNNGWASE